MAVIFFLYRYLCGGKLVDYSEWAANRTVPDTMMISSLIRNYICDCFTINRCLQIISRRRPIFINDVVNL